MGGVVRLVVDRATPSDSHAYLSLPRRSPVKISIQLAEYLERCAVDERAPAETNSTSGIALARVLAGSTLRTIRVDRGPHLKRLQIEVGLKCNLGCTYCYSNSGIKNTQRMSSDEILTHIDQADALGVLTVDLTGGELLLDPDWRAYVRRARGYGMNVTLHTNGTLLTKDAVNFIREVGVTAVQVSLDSHIAAINDDNRRAKGAFVRAQRGLDLLKTSTVSTRVSLMASRSNRSSLPETIAFVQARYPASVIHVDRIIATGGASDGVDCLTAAEFWDLMVPYRGEGVAAAKLCESADTRDFEPECGVAYSFVYITASGEYAACPTMTTRENPSLFFGPTSADCDLGTAWYESTYFNSFRFTNCSNVTTCPSGAACGGGCRSNAYAGSGKLDSPDVIACNLNKNPTTTFMELPRFRRSYA